MRTLKPKNHACMHVPNVCMDVILGVKSVKCLLMNWWASNVFMVDGVSNVDT